LIYKCGGIDKRTIEKFEKVRLPDLFDSLWPYHLFRQKFVWWGRGNWSIT